LRSNSLKLEICTLFEGDFHHGVAALANSLYCQGYRGTIWVGYRGELPAWARGEASRKCTRYSPASDLTLVFVPLDTKLHFTHYKPQWMLSIFNELSPECQALAYFDPDIVVKCRWSFFEDWVSRGIALCEDVNHYMPADHPTKLSWAQFLNENGYQVHRTGSQYFNGGFLGLRRPQLDALETWARLIGLVESESGSLQGWRTLDRSHRFMSANQDTLNALAMTTVHPEGMGFVPGGFTMCHAIGSLKPWHKHYIREALAGRPPTLADRGFWKYAAGPAGAVSRWRTAYTKASMAVAAALCRFIRRT
jgi:hypothetical protein